MKAFTAHQGIVAPMDRANVDTDMIIPKQFLKTIKRTGLGKNLFSEMRYDDNGAEKPDFVLNKEAYRNASILVAGDNFGCGSSREHAPWALSDYGFRVIIAPSFADIFYNNCVKNGLLLVRLEANEVDELFQQAQKSPDIQITTDLTSQLVTSADNKVYSFEMDSFAKTCLLNGLDQIGWTLQFEDKIASFESKLMQEKPWLA